MFADLFPLDRNVGFGPELVKPYPGRFDDLAAKRKPKKVDCNESLRARRYDDHYDISDREQRDLPLNWDSET